MRTKLTAAFLLLTSSLALAGDWPAFRGPTASGFAAPMEIGKDWTAKPPKELWRVPMTDDGFSAPAIADGKVFIVDHSGVTDIVRALDLKTGEPVWQYSYADMEKPNYGFSRSTPSVADGKVYTTSMAGKVHCLDAKTGAVVWMVDMNTIGGRRPGWGYAGSPLVDGDRLLITPGGPALLVALDRTTGKPIWKSPAGEVGYSTPYLATINGAKQYLLFSASGLNSFSHEDGKLLWSIPWKTPYEVNAAQPLVIGDAVFFSTGYGVGCAMYDITAEGPKERWRNKNIQAQFTSGIVNDGLIYSTTDPGDLVCLDPKTGEPRWRQKGFEKGGIVAIGDVILALNGGGGDLVMVKITPEKYEELGRAKPLTGQSWTAPVAADGKVFVRNKPNLACLGVTP